MVGHAHSLGHGGRASCVKTSGWVPQLRRNGIGARLRDSAPRPSETHRSRLMRKREARSR